MPEHELEIKMSKEEMIVRISKLEAEVFIHQGMTELLLGFLAAKLGDQEIIRYFQKMVSSETLTKEASVVAKKYLDLEASFGRDIFHPGLTRQ